MSKTCTQIKTRRKKEHQAAVCQKRGHKKTKKCDPSHDESITGSEAAVLEVHHEGEKEIFIIQEFVNICKNIGYYSSDAVRPLKPAYQSCSGTDCVFLFSLGSRFLALPQSNWARVDMFFRVLGVMVVKKKNEESQCNPSNT